MSKPYTVDKPYIAGELGGRWRVGWSLASYVVAGELCGRWQAVVFGGSLVFGRCLGGGGVCWPECLPRTLKLGLMLRFSSTKIPPTLQMSSTDANHHHNS